ncbi:MAG: beta-aspartyl-peptidase [Candidatus Aminicenantes bacterium]|nr:beta-aspartyl-peptidase [Candidatus Aminicenantes bacterium]
MVLLIKSAEVFAPEPLGVKDILVLNGTIESISDPDEIRIQGLDIELIDATDKIITPGFIDSHVHIIGGGGEGGPSTRAPEIRFEDIITSGVTTLIGCLGTDGSTRHMESLLAKAKGLEVEGLTTYIFTGSYQIPVMTLTKSVLNDLIFIDKVIGAGEIALSDHRSSQPTFEEFAHLAAECRVGGMLGGKAGILHCHIGAGQRKLELLFRLITETEIPPTQVIPTHTNRSNELLKEGISFISQGGYIDLTANLDPEDESHSLSIASCVRQCLEKRVPLSHITVSSDSNGSLPVFDAQGNYKGLTIATEKSLLENFRYLIHRKILSLEDALSLFSSNPAHFYKFNKKGEIKQYKDADLLLFDKDLNLEGSIINGKIAMLSSKLIMKGTFS